MLESDRMTVVVSLQPSFHLYAVMAAEQTIGTKLDVQASGKKQKLFLHLMNGLLVCIILATFSFSFR